MWARTHYYRTTTTFQRGHANPRHQPRWRVATCTGRASSRATHAQRLPIPFKTRQSPSPVCFEEVTDIICLALISFCDSVRTHRKLRLHAMKLTKTQINLLFNGLKRLSHLTFDNVWFDGSVFRDILHEQWDLLGRHPALPSIESTPQCL